MSDKLENALADAIEKANSGIDAATEFVMSELPEVIQQALTWYAIESAIFFCIGLIMALFAFKFFKSQLLFLKTKEGTARWARWSEHDHDLNGLGMLYVGICAILDLVYICMMIDGVSNWDWIKILVAPKLWLIEYAAKLAS